jgi:hypothetical protein
MNAMVCTPGPVLMLEPAGVVHTTLEWVPVGAAVPDAFETVLAATAEGEWCEAYWNGQQWLYAADDGHYYGVARWARVEVPA